MEKQSSGFPRNEQKTCAHREPVPLKFPKYKVSCPGTKFEHSLRKYAQQRRFPRHPAQPPRNKHTTLGACPASPYAALDVRAFRELVLLRQWTRLNKCCVQMLSTFSFFQTKYQIFFDLDCFSILPNFRYCSMLPSDRFTHLSPVYKIEEVEEDGKKLFKCELELPINCQLRRTICVSANKITVLTLV